MNIYIHINTLARDKGLSIMPGAKKTLWQLQEDGHNITIIIDNDSDIFFWVNFLLLYGMSFAEIAPHYSQKADLIIDNRQLGGFGGLVSNVCSIEF